MNNAVRNAESVLYALVSFLPYLAVALWPFRSKLRFSGAVTGVLIGVMVLIQIAAGLTASSGYSAYTGLLSVLSTLSYALFYLAAVKQSPGKLLFVLLMISNIGNMVVMASKCLEGVLFPELAVQTYRWSFSVVSMCVQAVVIPSTLLFVRRFLQKALELPSETKTWNYLWLIPLTFYLFWYHGLYFNSISSLEQALQPENTVFTVLINLGACIVYGVIANALQQADENVQLAAQNHQLEIQNLQYANLKERMDETRQVRHDLRQHVTMMYSFVREKQYEQLEEYLEQFVKRVSKEKMITYCGNLALNAVFSYYGQVAQEDGSEYNVQASIPDQLPFQEEDLTVLFGNLLENACEGCRKVPQEKRNIRVKMYEPNPNVLVFSIENSSSGELHRENGRIRSTKHSGCGIGTESARNIVKRYNGVLNIENKDGVFRVSGMLSSV